MKLLVPFALIALILVTPVHTRAQDDPAPMQQEMTSYFHGERRGGYGFAGVGAASLAAGGLMLSSSSDFSRGMSYPMLGLGAAQLLVGGIVIFQAGPRIAEFTEAIRVRPEEYRAEELTRMRGVTRTFRILFYSEVALAVGGLGMGVHGLQADRDTIAGLGFGLSIQALLLLGQDTLASGRAGRYARALEGFQVALSPGEHGGEHGYWLAYGARW